MKRIKRLIICVTAFVCVLSLAACGESRSQTLQEAGQVAMAVMMLHLHLMKMEQVKCL